MIQRPAFVGRERELDDLAGLFRECTAGAPRLALVGGEAGIGKSRLVAELLDQVAAAGGQVLVGSCVNFGTAPPPYLPVIDALRAVSDLLDDDDLCCLLPDLGDVRAQLTAGHGRGSQARMFEQLLGTFQQLAELRPLVLVLEDIHWADASTLDLLSFLVRNLGTAAVLLVATYRTDELHRNHPLRPVLAELRRHRRTVPVELEPFGVEQVRVQLDGLRGTASDEAVVRQVFERSDGIPFFVEELAAACTDDELPSSVQAVLSAKLDALGERSRPVVEAAAVAGATVPHPLLLRMTGLDEGALATAVREAIAAAVLEVADDGRAYRFRHALLHEVVVAEMLPGDRIRHHAAVAEALGADPTWAEGGSATVLAEQAWHWRKANRLAPALRVSVEAAEAAERVYAFQEALAHHEAVLELWDSVGEAERPAGLRRLDVLARAAADAGLAGQVSRAVALGRKAIEAVPADEPVLAGHLRTCVADYLRVLGRHDESIAIVEEALAILPPGPSGARALALAVLAAGVGLRHGVVRGCAPAAEAAAMAAAVGDAEAEGRARNSLGVSLAGTGDLDGAAAELEQALALARQVGDLDGLVRGWINLADVHMRAGRSAQALAVADEGADELAALGVRLRAGLFLALNAAECEIELGHWEAAGARMTAMAGAEASTLTSVHLLLTRGFLAMRRGDLAEAADRLAEVEPVVRRMADAQFTGALLLRQAELALWRGDPAGALAAAGRALDDAVVVDDPRDVAELRSFVARAAADAADVGLDVGEVTADGAVDVLLERAGEGATMYRALAEAEASRVSTPDPEAWAAAAKLADAADRPFHVAYACWREAEAWLPAHRGEATAALRRAWVGADRLGASLLLDHVTGLARRARLDLDEHTAAAPEPSSPLARYGLTPREEEVLALVGDGLTNREIGERLYINVKTASVHVSNILAKLGVASRVQAATLVSRLGRD